MPKEIRKWSNDKLGFKSVTNDDLVCKDCKYANDINPVGRCMVFTVKPNKVLLGGECNEFKNKK